MLVRQHAIEMLFQIIHSSVKAEVALDQFIQRIEPRDRGLLHELTFGVLRRFFSLQADMSRYCKSKPDDLAHLALLLGSYQLRHMRIPAHAVVSETVAAIKLLEPKAAGFVNAVLRRVAESEPPVRLKPYQRAELPKWMYAHWRNSFGADQVQRCGEAFRQPPPLSVAVFDHRDSWIEKVKSGGGMARAGELSPYAVLLPAGTDVTRLPGFESGLFTVMDQAAQSVVLALGTQRPKVILDVCAAPGGKTALLSHRFPEAKIIAVELKTRRIARLQENLARLRCNNVKVVQADGLNLPVPEASVDAIVLDAPCSASGVIRRHPDAKFLHNAGDVKRLAEMQKALLQESMRAIKADGRLVYAVCSIHPEENEQVAGLFSGEQQRLFPSDTYDGFFIATSG